MSFSWSNFVTILEVFVAELIFLYSFPRRKFFLLRLFLSLGLCAVAVGFLLPESIPVRGQELQNLYRFARYFTLFLVTIFGMWVCFDAKFSPVLSACASGYAMQHIANKIMLSLDSFLHISEAYQTNLGMTWLQSYFMTELTVFPFVYLLGLVLFGRIAARHEIYRNSGSMINILSVTMIIICIGLNRFTGEEGRRYYAIALCLFALIIQISVHGAVKLREENKIITRLIFEERKQYNQSKANIELINIKAHDLKKKLGAMKEKLSDEEIDSIRKTVEVYDRNIETGSEVLDVIFTERGSRCAEHGVKLTCLGDGSLFSFMSSMDLYSLFSNALDNAIEAVMKLEDRDKRIVSMVIENHGDYITANVTNYFDGALEMKGGVPVTTKTFEPGYHGYGIKSMKLIAEKYGGTLDINVQGDKFMLNILLERRED